VEQGTGKLKWGMSQSGESMVRMDRQGDNLSQGTQTTSSEQVQFSGRGAKERGLANLRLE